VAAVPPENEGNELIVEILLPDEQGELLLSKKQFPESRVALDGVPVTFKAIFIVPDGDSETVTAKADSKAVFIALIS